MKGKIIVCNSTELGSIELDSIRETHAIGSIYLDDSVDYIVPDIVPLPATIIDTHLGNNLISYINSTK